MDKLLRKIGLSGRSIVPMLIGFGCTVPAVMSTRTLPSERDRRMTILLTPFMSCTAKLPIYAFFVNAFFPKSGWLVMTGLYAFGIITGILVALLFRKTLFQGEAVPFVMELPNYRMPSPRSVLQLLWEKARDFLHRAFSVILVATIVVWFLQTFDFHLMYLTDRMNPMTSHIIMALTAATIEMRSVTQRKFYPSDCIHISFPHDRKSSFCKILNIRSHGNLSCRQIFILRTTYQRHKDSHKHER
jgi:ferrous iron transport protein B